MKFVRFFSFKTFFFFWEHIFYILWFVNLLFKKSKKYTKSLDIKFFFLEGEFRSRTAFCERNIKALGQNSPFLEGVDFFATAKKDQGSVGSRSPMIIQRDPTVACRHYPVDLRSPPLLQEGEFRSKCGIYLWKWYYLSAKLIWTISDQKNRCCSF